MIRTVAVTICALALIASPALAEEGRIPIFEPVVLDGSLGDVSGEYVLTRNVTAGGSTRAITIQGTGSELIQIDLNGFTARGGATAAEAIFVNNVQSFRILNGNINGVAPTGSLLHVTGGTALTDKVAIEQVRFSDGSSAIIVRDVENVKIQDNVISGSNDGGIVLLGAATDPPLTGVIQRNTVRDVAVNGIIVDDFSANLAIRDNELEDVAGLCIVVGTSRGARISGNAVTGGGTGIFIDASYGCSIVSNSVTGTQFYGFEVRNTDYCLIERNVSSGNARMGMIVDGSSGHMINRNVFSGNLETGLWLIGDSDRNQVEGNTLVDNAEWGLRMSIDAGDNTYGRNMARGNGGIGCGVPSTCGPPEFCDEGAGNASFGDNLLPGPPPC